MKSPAERLNSSGSSRLMVWPQFGITASAAEAMFCFIRMPGLRQSLATALFASSATLADKWNMPVRSNERNYFTRNIMQFAEDAKKATDGKVEIVIHPEDSLTKQPEVKRAVQTGQVQLGELLMSMHSNESALFGVDAVPFLASNNEEGQKLLKVMRPILEERLKRQGM